MARHAARIVGGDFNLTSSWEGEKMGCIYENNGFGEDAGKCNMWSPDIEMRGCSDDGCCVCSDDPDPNVMCDTYESDNTCFACGTDLNIGECTCDEDEDY
jgi:hypothetical protein